MGFRFLQILSEYKPKVIDAPTDKLVLCFGILFGFILIISLIFIIHDSGRNK